MLRACRLNELECVDGMVWANAWLTDTIVRIDPDQGAITGTLDLAGLWRRRRPPRRLPTPPRGSAERASPPRRRAPSAPPPDVLNGIAWDAAAGHLPGHRQALAGALRDPRQRPGRQRPAPSGQPAKGTRGRPGTSRRVRKRLPASGWAACSSSDSSSQAVVM